MRSDRVVNHDDPAEVEKHIEYIRSLKGIQIHHNQEINGERSISVNNYYWAIVDYVCEATGYDRYELHEEIKRKWNSTILFTDDMELLSTKNNDNEEMWKLCMLVRRFFNKFFYVRGRRSQFYIPEPTVIIRPPKKTIKT